VSQRAHSWRVWFGCGWISGVIALKHHPIATDDGEEVRSFSVASAFVADVKPQFGLVERNRGVQIVDDEEGNSSGQHERNRRKLESLMFITYAGRLAQSGTDG
jgi:hypothetical protein